MSTYFGIGRIHMKQALDESLWWTANCGGSCHTRGYFIMAYFATNSDWLESVEWFVIDLGEME